jgi:RNA polymerase sigma factor (TIGR02999 family)
MDPLTGEVTRLLGDLRAGKPGAQDELYVLLYKELRRLAAARLRSERRDHTLQPTALVHEAYLRLIKQRDQNWQSRSHFFGVSAHIMREILCDYARQRINIKRGGPERPIPLDEATLPAIQKPRQLVALDDALSVLETFDERQSRIVELRFFGGLTEEEIGHVLGISVRTVKRDWNVARAWLYTEMKK